MTPHEKERRLAGFVDAGMNVAQFVSFSSGVDPEPRYWCFRDGGEVRATTIEEWVSELLGRSRGSVNVRSWVPGREKGNPFHYGLTKTDEAAALVRQLGAQGWNTIVNETIDVNDGGVSGVSLGGIVEFAPGGTPRIVEEPGAAALPRDTAVSLLATVYGVPVQLPNHPGQRVEFSLHPTPVGVLGTHTLIWEMEEVGAVELRARVSWPNAFSRFIGDKAYGLLVGHCLGLPVPRIRAVCRNVAPFEFGRPTGTGDVWVRTCPREQLPGKFSTILGWVDIFALMAREDPHGEALCAVLVQDGVAATFSGATLPRPDSDGDFVEGVAGHGDSFMQGEHVPDQLPDRVVRAVRELAARAREHLGPVRLEWAYDGANAWLLQLHVSSDLYEPGVLNPGEASEWLPFDPAEGLDKLRAIIPAAQERAAGIVVTGPVGLTSHVGDLLRKAGVPARLTS